MQYTQVTVDGLNQIIVDLYRNIFGVEGRIESALVIVGTRLENILLDRSGVSGRNRIIVLAKSIVESFVGIFTHPAVGAFQQTDKAASGYFYLLAVRVADGGEHHIGVGQKITNIARPHRHLDSLS